MLAQIAGALRVSTPLMYLRAGLLNEKDGQGVLAAIAADPDLTLTQKQSLTQIYETFRRENARLESRTGRTTSEVPQTRRFFHEHHHHKPRSPLRCTPWSALATCAYRELLKLPAVTPSCATTSRPGLPNCDPRCPARVERAARGAAD